MAKPGKSWTSRVNFWCLPLSCYNVARASSGLLCWKQDFFARLSTGQVSHTLSFCPSSKTAALFAITPLPSHVPLIPHFPVLPPPSSTPPPMQGVMNKAATYSITLPSPQHILRHRLLVAFHNTLYAIFLSSHSVKIKWSGPNCQMLGCVIWIRPWI